MKFNIGETVEKILNILMNNLKMKSLKESLGFQKRMKVMMPKDSDNWLLISRTNQSKQQII